jgi:hypothetical protein
MSVAPTPAQKIMPIQLKVLKSGRASWPPSRILP